MENIDIAVVGAGVTGLAIARELAAQHFCTCVLERHPRPGLDTSTHNSGVIHAGIYYPADSLKAKMCVEGRQLLYEFCARHDVPHWRCGKLIVGTDDGDRAQLEALAARGRANGVEGLEIVDRRFIAAREPAVAATWAIHSPYTGIVDAEALVKALLKSAQAEGAIFLPASPLVGAENAGERMALHTPRETIVARQVVNAAGLYADDVSRTLGGEAFTLYPSRGEYAELVPAKRSLINALVYPLPHGHGLGVHFIRTTSGAVWLGPTTHFHNRKDDYETDRLPVEAFLEPARHLLPQITLADLRLSGSGIRAKLNPPQVPFADFLIRRDTQNPAVIQAAGIESPGLTSCLAIARKIGQIAREI